jgi:hypothetical protein
LAITGFGSTLRRNQTHCLIQTQLTPGDVSRFTQCAGRLQRLESILIDDCFHILLLWGGGSSWGQGCFYAVSNRFNFGTPVPSQGVSPTLIKTIKSLDMAPRYRVLNPSIGKTTFGDLSWPQPPHPTKQHSSLAPSQALSWRWPITLLKTATNSC